MASFKDLEIVSMNEIQRVHKGYFFAPDTLKWWKTILPNHGVYSAKLDAILFITSERAPLKDSQRAYVLRSMNPGNGSINTLEVYNDKRKANREIGKLCANGLKQYA